MSTGNRTRQCNDFALEIFRSRFDDLDLEKRWFVFQHVKEYEKYRDKITQRLIRVFHLTGGSQFQIIREWYYKRIPLYIILQAIDQCLKSLIRNNNPLLSLKYFEPEINNRFINHQCQTFRNPQETREEKWLWSDYQSWKEEKDARFEFNLFEGPIRIK